MEEVYILENWSFGTSNDPYTPPELITCHFRGNVFGHPRFNDGEMVTTSGIVGFDAEAGTFTTESGSHYKLGQVAEDYEAAFPHAKKRILAAGGRMRTAEEGR